jgi:hypothetical protein
MHAQRSDKDSITLLSIIDVSGDETSEPVRSGLLVRVSFSQLGIHFPRSRMTMTR